MSRALCLFALLAIMPAALHAAPALAGDNLLVPICTGDGQTRLVAIPKGGSGRARSRNASRVATAAPHASAGSARNLSQRNDEPPPPRQ